MYNVFICILQQNQLKKFMVKIDENNLAMILARQKLDIKYKKNLSIVYNNNYEEYISETFTERGQKEFNESYLYYKKLILNNKQ